MSALRGFAGLVLRILRELSDESAYERHLRAHGVKHSGEEWRRFCAHRFEAKYRRPRCC